MKWGQKRSALGNCQTPVRLVHWRTFVMKIPLARTVWLWYDSRKYVNNPKLYPFWVKGFRAAKSGKDRIIPNYAPLEVEAWLNGYNYWDEQYGKPKPKEET